MRPLLRVQGNGILLAHFHAPVRKAAAAGVGNFIAADRAFIAGYFYNLYYIWVALIPTHGEFNPFSQYSPFLVYAAAHCGHVSGNYATGDIQNLFLQGTLPCRL